MQSYGYKKGLKTVAKNLIERIGIHLGLEVTVVAFIDQLIANVVLGIFFGIVLVEGVQALWRKFLEYYRKRKRR